MSYIGVFDSGLGGLSILNSLTHNFPNESFVYVADTCNLPYGDKTHNQLHNILEKNLNFFHDAKAIVIACNTLSSILPIRQIKIPTINIISSLIDTLITDYSHIKNIGILATTFTSNSKIYNTTIQDLNSNINIYTTAAPLLVPIIESLSHESLDIILKDYLDFFSKDIKGLILACTHYNLLQKNINNIRPDLTIIDPYKGVIKELKNILQTTPVLNHYSTLKFFTSSYNPHLQYQSEKIMGKKIDWEEISIVF